MTEHIQKAISHVLVGVGTVCCLVGLIGWWQANKIQGEMRSVLSKVSGEVTVGRFVVNLEHPEGLLALSAEDMRFFAAYVAEDLREFQAEHKTPTLKNLAELTEKLSFTAAVTHLSILRARLDFWRILAWVCTIIGGAALSAHFILRFAKQRKAAGSDTILSLR